MSAKEQEEAAPAVPSVVTVSEPPLTLPGNPEWRLMQYMASPTSSELLGSAITDDESHIIEALKREENDGIYSIKSGQEGNILV